MAYRNSRAYRYGKQAGFAVVRDSYSGAKSLLSGQNLLFIVLALYLYFKGKGDGKKSTGAADAFFDSSQVDPDKFTITVDEAREHAENLLDAFNGGFMGVGTDLDEIESVVYNINAYDLGLIHEQFGTHTYWLVGSHWFGKDLDLKNWFKSEIATDEPVYIKVKQLYHEIGIYL